MVHKKCFLCHFFKNLVICGCNVRNYLLAVKGLQG